MNTDYIDDEADARAEAREDMAGEDAEARDEFDPEAELTYEDERPLWL